MLVQPVGAGEPKELPTPGLSIMDHAVWSDDGRQIAYEALTSQNDWNVYTQKIDGGPPVLVKTQGRNAYPTLSPDGTVAALHEEGGGISLYRARTRQPTAVKGVLASESPIRFVEAGRSLLVTDKGGKEVILTVVDLASGRRKTWKRLFLSVQRSGKTIVVTPGLKYYAYFSPRYSSDLYLVENLH
jgi:Tol biopolymer transport system component